MSFWDGVKEFGKDCAHNVIAKSQRVSEYKMEYESLSKDELLHELHHTFNDERKLAIKSILRDRGYIK